MTTLISTVTIDPMTDADVKQIAEIERHCYALPWHENAYHTEIANRCAVYLVARVDGEPVGYAGMWVVMDEAHITTIAVDPPHRGRHIGERLLHSLLSEAVRRNAVRASLEVREHNTVAQTLYEKYLFRRAAIRKNYYTDNHENAIVMWIDGMQDDDYRRMLADRLEQMQSGASERTRD